MKAKFIVNVVRFKIGSITSSITFGVEVLNLENIIFERNLVFPGSLVFLDVLRVK